MPEYERFDTHVLVIGGGGAGARAAIEASEYGDTILISRAILGKGGCTPMAEGGLNAVLNATYDSCSLHSGDTLRGGAYLNDPVLVNRLVNEAPERMEDLVGWGAVFDVTPEQTVAQRPFGGQSRPRTCYAGDRTGHEIMMTLVEHLRTMDIEIFNETPAISLLRNDNSRVCGAAGLDRRGHPIIFLADAVVLATGGGTKVFDISTNCATGNGQGYAMGYCAGAELVDMEMIQFHPTGAVHPYDARGRLITEAVRGEGGILKNRDGERFMSRYDPERMELSTRDVVARSIATEISEGRGTDKGGVYLDVSYLPSSVIEERLPLMLEQFLQFGVDIRKEPMEVAPTAHHVMGGLKINEWCETSVAGLFACGEVTGGVHGANRLGGNALADTQVFGRRAGISAGKSPKNVNKQGYMKDLESVEKRLSGYMEGDTNPFEIMSRLKNTMWENAGIFRDEIGLNKAMTEITKMESMMPKATTTANLIDCCTVTDMLLFSRLIVTGAILRRESRGAHVRTDLDDLHTPDRSPYGHTYQSLAGSGIERREGEDQ